MAKATDFIAELYYRTTKEGGRKTPAFSGYRPQIKFAFSEMQTSGQQRFINKDKTYPGDTVIAEITIVSPHLFVNKLSIGLDFEFREGARVIGTGRILEIFNDLLIA